MELCVVGGGYVGLVVAACLADLGHEVRCVEHDAGRLATLRTGRAPFYEPGLDEMLDRTLGAGRLTFEARPEEAARGVSLCFLAVGTPPGADGTPDLGDVLAAADAVAPVLERDALLVVKSTVPPGSADRLRARLAAAGRADVDVVSNPEFLAEGRAVETFTQPDRIVLGYARARSGRRMARLYAPITRQQGRVLHMDNRSAELAKYASNAALAARLSLINELSRVAEAVGADIERVRQVVGADARIGATYLLPGPGFGGSCFPKDLLALELQAAALGVPLDLVPAVRAVNERQKRVLFEKLRALVGPLRGARVAVWGLAFKPETDDVRQSPALALIDALLDAGAVVVAYDPKAMGQARARYGDRVTFAEGPYEAAEAAHALAVVTDWREFRSPDLARLAQTMSRRIVVDGRNLYEPAELARAGFVYASIGRPTPVAGAVDVTSSETGAPGADDDPEDPT